MQGKGSGLRVFGWFLALGRSANAGMREITKTQDPKTLTYIDDHSIFPKEQSIP